MKQWFRSFSKLQWQLSLSYILVVVVTIPALLLVGLASVLLVPAPLPSEQLVQELLKTSLVTKIEQELQQKSPDVNLLWKLSQSIIKSADLNVAETLGAVIINRTGQPVVPLTERTSFDPQLFKPPAAQALIQTAFANDRHLANLTYTYPDGSTLVAVPLSNAQGYIIGVFIVEVRGLPDTPDGGQITNPVLAILTRLVGAGPAVGGGGASSGTVAATFSYILILILVISLIGVGFGVFSARRITRRLRRITSAAHAWSQGNFQVSVQDRSSDELGQLALDLNSMAHQVQTLLDTRQEFTLMEERQRVARDLHDSVKQSTFAISLLIGAAQANLPAKLDVVRANLVKAGELADQTRHDLTAILQQLRPAILVEKGLGNFLQDYTRQWTQRTGIITEFSSPVDLKVPLDLAETLFRVTQEALANVARHSLAQQVEVRLEQEPGQITLLIHDDGQGFEVAQREGKGQGLTNMRERIEKHRGNLTIISSTDGTLIKATVGLGRNHLKD